MYAVMGQEWSEYYTKMSSHVISLLDTVKSILKDENKAVYAVNKIKKAANWNTSIDNYN